MDLVLQEKYLVNRIYTKFVMMIEDQNYKCKAWMNVLNIEFRRKVQKGYKVSGFQNNINSNLSLPVAYTKEIAKYEKLVTYIMSMLTIFSMCLLKLPRHSILSYFHRKPQQFPQF